MSLPEAIPEQAAPPAADRSPPGPRPDRHWLRTATNIVLVRLRFLLAFLAILLLVGYWDVLRGYWDKLTRPGAAGPSAVSGDTEYWCPMCPGVLSDWPGKCPVCNMALVRRKKGDATPLPDGVLARMQLSPYRIQLAGIQTAPVEYRPLAVEVELVGLAEWEGKPNFSGIIVRGEVFAKDAAAVSAGARVAATTDALPGHSFPGKVAELAPALAADTRTLSVRLEIEDPHRELRPGMLIRARVRTPLAASRLMTAGWREEWQLRAAADLARQALFAPAGQAGGGWESLICMAGQRLLLHKGLVMAVPETAVVDTGSKRVAYVERMPGMFDAVEITVGRRCDGFYPVLRGLTFGERVVTAGALLLDAETRLNPSIAASYFGAERRGAAPTDPSSSVQTAAPPGEDDKSLIARQKICPVTDEPLGSMGAPFRAFVDGKTVFLCCKACEPALRKDPAKYLAKLNRK